MRHHNGANACERGRGASRYGSKYCTRYNRNSSQSTPGSTDYKFRQANERRRYLAAFHYTAGQNEQRYRKQHHCVYFPMAGGDKSGDFVPTENSDENEYGAESEWNCYTDDQQYTEEQ